MQIILIGPMAAGKSTIAPLLAERLGMPRYSLDELRWEYYAEIGYDEAKAGRLAKHIIYTAGKSPAEVCASSSITMIKIKKKITGKSENAIIKTCRQLKKRTSCFLFRVNRMSDLHCFKDLPRPEFSAPLGAQHSPP